jgi:hypothetical protein
MKIEQISEKFDIDVGAPKPTILSNEQILYLIFYTRLIDTSWNGTRDNLKTDKDDGIVTLKFNRFAQFKFGNPNDESLGGHPYFKLGLKAYSIQKVLDSDWIRELRKMNAVHPYHEDRHFAKYEHFIFTFHDTCFEIVAEGYSIEENSLTNIKEEIQRIVELL